MISADLFFSEKDSQVPVIVDIREIDSATNQPSASILPLSRVSVGAGSVAVSTNAATPTRFNFEGPVYLENGKSYVITVDSASDKYKLWYGAADQLDVATNSPVTIAPQVGPVFLSRSSSWTKDDRNALKFAINRARFDTSTAATIVLNDLNNTLYNLPTTPFETLQKSNIVRVYHPNHGFFAMTAGGLPRSIVKIALSTSTNTDGVTINGIPVSEFIAEHDVLDVELDYFTIRVSTRATSTGRASGDNSFQWVANRNIRVNMYRPVVDYVQPPATSIGWQSKLMNGRTLTDVSDLLTIDSEYSNIIVDKTQSTSYPKVILNAQTAALSDDPSEKSMYLKATISSERNNLSPMIDMQRASVIAIATRLNNPAEIVSTLCVGSISAASVTFTVDDATGIQVGDIVRGPGLANNTVVSNIVGTTITVSNAFESAVADDSPFSFYPVDTLTGQVLGYDYSSSYRPSTAAEYGSVSSKYITKRVNLPQAANTISVIMLINRPSETHLDVFVKTQRLDNAGADFDALPWQQLTEPDDYPVTDNASDWRRVEFTHDESDIAAFSVKVELRSLNSSRQPKFKNFKAIALT